MGVYQKLATIQKTLIAPKGQRNDFGKYNYRSCEDILKALKPLCEENGCMCYITNDLEHIGEFNYVKATVTLVDMETGEHLVSTAHAREEATKKGMDGSQITGASSSYARKYALAGMFCIDNEKDSDATNTGELTKDELVNEANLKTKILKFMNKQKMTKENISKVCASYNVESVSQMSKENCEHYIAYLKSKGVDVNE